MREVYHYGQQLPSKGQEVLVKSEEGYITFCEYNGKPWGDWWDEVHHVGYIVAWAPVDDVLAALNEAFQRGYPLFEEEQERQYNEDE